MKTSWILYDPDPTIQLLIKTIMKYKILSWLSNQSNVKITQNFQHSFTPGFEIKWINYSFMNSMKFVIPLHLISGIKIPNDAVTPQRQSQFTPKMKTNVVPCLLSSLVWIDQYNACNRLTNFMELMCWVISKFNDSSMKTMLVYPVWL